MKQSGKITVAVAAFALLLGGYLTADAHDVVPGLVTLAPPYVQPAPFPVPPGAMPGPVPAYTLSDLPSDAPIPSPDDVEPLVASLVADARMGPHSGVLVVDALTGETLGSNLATTGFTPASTQKILTGAAALTVLDPEATLPTTVMLSGSGDLYLVGGGDMMLAAGEGNPDLVNGRAGLADLAEQAAGQVTVTGQTSVRLFVDDTLFEGPTISAAVPPGEQNRFVAAASSLAVGIASSTAPTDQSTPRVPDPAMHAAQAFARALADRGVQVTGQITRAATPSTAREIGAVHSAPIIDVTEHAMAISENTITEVLGRLVAIEKGMPGSLEASLTAVKQSMTALDVDMTGATLVDLSGLGRGSALTPTQLVDVVAATIDPANPHLRELANGLPLANLTGTLAARYGGQNPARGWARAKTGSLPGVTALTGTVITSQDRMLLFAVVADQAPQGGQWGARVALDNFIGSLAALGS